MIPKCYPGDTHVGVWSKAQECYFVSACRSPGSLSVLQLVELVEGDDVPYDVPLFYAASELVRNVRMIGFP